MSSWYLPHPYGVLPRGNCPSVHLHLTLRRLGTLTRTVQTNELESKHEQPMLELFQQILLFLPPNSVCVFAACSTGSYVYCHCSDYWKVAYQLHAWNPAASTSGLLNSSAVLDFHCCWKTTLVRRFIEIANVRGAQGKEAKAPNSFEHQPLHISKDRAIYNDHLFHSWLCTILPCDYKLTPKKLPGAMLKHNTPTQYLSKFKQMPRRSSLSVEDFESEFDARNFPVVLAGAAKSWPLFQLLDGNLQNLAVKKDAIFSRPVEDTGPLLFRCEHMLMTVDQYCTYSKQQQDERPIYLFDSEALTSLRDGMIEVPHHFSRDDFFKVLGSDRPKYRWLIAGPRRGGSSFHVDPNYTSAWNACLTGRKRWIMFPPGHVPCGVTPSADMSTVATPLSLTEWLLNHYEGTLDALKDSGVECVCEAGDIVFVPCGWWHFVINLEDSVAVTQNYVSRANLSHVLTFLRNMKSSISGVGEDEEDCPAASAAARQDSMAERFASSMQASYPDLMERVEEGFERKRLAKRARKEVSQQLANISSEGFSFQF